MTHYRKMYRGLSPHKIMPMPGTHNSIELTWECSSGLLAYQPASSYRRSASNFLLDEWRHASYIVGMIKTFKCKNTEKLFNDLDVKRFRSISKVARIKLEVLNAAVSLNSLRVPPGNRLEQLKGNRKGQRSIRINDQWRICFVWKDENATEVEIVDYHKG